MKRRSFLAACGAALGAVVLPWKVSRAKIVAPPPRKAIVALMEIGGRWARAKTDDGRTYISPGGAPEVCALMRREGIDTNYWRDCVIYNDSTLPFHPTLAIGTLTCLMGVQPPWLHSHA